MKSARVAVALAWLALVVLLLPAGAQPPGGKEKEDPAHNELRALRDGLIEAIREEDIEKQLGFVSKDVVVVWQNGEVVRGHQGLRDFYKKIMSGPDKVFRGYAQPPSPEELTILYGGDTGISYGTDVGKYRVSGRDFEMKNYWTATLVKEGGKWVIASYHVSANVLDNPPLSAARTNAYLAGGVAAVLGLVAGMVVGWILRGQPRSTQPSAP
jgi:ketosteroid isomerase-like protein